MSGHRMWKVAEDEPASTDRSHTENNNLQARSSIRRTHSVRGRRSTEDVSSVRRRYRFAAPALPTSAETSTELNDESTEEDSFESYTAPLSTNTTSNSSELPVYAQSIFNTEDRSNLRDEYRNPSEPQARLVQLTNAINRLPASTTAATRARLFEDRDRWRRNIEALTTRSAGANVSRVETTDGAVYVSNTAPRWPIRDTGSSNDIASNSARQSVFSGARGPIIRVGQDESAFICEMDVDDDDIAGTDTDEPRPSAPRMSALQILERYARRDDIPDEWWASIGLNRLDVTNAPARR